MSIPPYPTLPEITDANISSLLNKRMGSTGSILERKTGYNVKDIFDINTYTGKKLAKRYTM